MVYDTACLVCKCSKTKNICDRFIAIICNDIEACVYILDHIRQKKRQDRWRYLWDGRRLHQVVLFCFGWVLRIPCRGRFMWPFAVAGLGLRYLRINRSDKLGHPLRNPRWTALRRVEILGLHWDWWVNFTALARVFTECVNVARVVLGSLASIGRCGARPLHGPGRDRTLGSGAVHTFVVGIGRVHKSVLRSL
jgi:hypothetical protein